MLALLCNRLFRCGYQGALDSSFRPWRAFGPLFGIGAGPALGAAGVRYIAFPLRTRRWWSSQPLPWRLGRFLGWCCDTGLTRTAGIAYQFRHRELQDFLTRGHTAPSRYPEKHRERAVREVRSTGRPIAHVAKDLGIHKEALRGWVRQAEADAGERDDRRSTRS
ncbi:transposase [Streptomyces rugosispiralis]|uniref:Transposase n=1 Tax=Streptomyces rugosispiralis TaxID=2967341 RepID=A0ABT1VEX7_9ACTN|nr:transposase [Streptomyces rugosispiralis]MCQ8195345.1 transposase [Streptomyces rugosispiralis]